MKLLRIEDDMDLGMWGIWVRTLDDAARHLDHDSCDLVLLDLGLPDGGADDYLVRPFVLADLLSRLRALACRSYGFDGDTIKVRARRVSVLASVTRLPLAAG